MEKYGIFNDASSFNKLWNTKAFCNRSEIVYFVSFGVEHVPGEIKELVGNKNIIANIFQVQATIQ